MRELAGRLKFRAGTRRSLKSGIFFARVLKRFRTALAQTVAKEHQQQHARPDGDDAAADGGEIPQLRRIADHFCRRTKLGGEQNEEADAVDDRLPGMRDGDRPAGIRPVIRPAEFAIPPCWRGDRIGDFFRGSKLVAHKKISMPGRCSPFLPCTRPGTIRQ